MVVTFVLVGYFIVTITYCIVVTVVDATEVVEDFSVSRIPKKLVSGSV